MGKWENGKIGPKRRRTLALSPLIPASAPTQEETSIPNQLRKQLTIEQFSESESEKGSNAKLHREVFTYFLQKLTKKEMWLN